MQLLLFHTSDIGGLKMNARHHDITAESHDKIQSGNKGEETGKRSTLFGKLDRRLMV
jgi:hypothetical protein